MPDPDPIQRLVGVRTIGVSPLRMMSVWNAALRQRGAVLVEERDEFLRTLRTTARCHARGAGGSAPPTADRVPVEAAPSGLIDEAIRTAVRSIEQLMIDENAQLDGAALERLAVGVEQVRRAAESAAVAVAERVVATNPFRSDGFFTGKAFLTHRLQLSKREAFHRCQMARMQPRLRLWFETFAAGEVGIEQTSLIAQIAANPHVPDDALSAREADLLDDAMSCRMRSSNGGRCAGRHSSTLMARPTPPSDSATSDPPP